MRFELNLATQPYENVRRFYAQWGFALGVIALLTAALVWFAASEWRRGSEMRARVAEVRREIDGLQRKQDEAAAKLAQPRNREVRDRSQFLNTLIARKTFSWTQVFADLEKLMPPQVQVVAIRPEITKENQLQINMQVAGRSRERALELLRRMEQSRTFRNPQFKSEKIAQQRAEPLQLEIVALYVPQLPEAGD